MSDLDLCPHCRLEWDGHVCPDRNAWTTEEKDAARVLMRRRDPSVRFAPSTEEMARLFGHRSQR